jgi:hypothetical protein
MLILAFPKRSPVERANACMTLSRGAECKKKLTAPERGAANR